MPTTERENRFHDVLRDRVGMSVRSLAGILQSRRSIGFIATQPLVARLTADPEVAAEVCKAGVILQVCGDELHAFAVAARAAGIGDADLVPGAARGTMDILTAWTQWAEKVLVF